MLVWLPALRGQYTGPCICIGEDEGQRISALCKGFNPVGAMQPTHGLLWVGLYNYSSHRYMFLNFSPAVSAECQRVTRFELEINKTLHLYRPTSSRNLTVHYEPYRVSAGKYAWQCRKQWDRYFIRPIYTLYIGPIQYIIGYMRVCVYMFMYMYMYNVCVVLFACFFMPQSLSVSLSMHT